MNEFYLLFGVIFGLKLLAYSFFLQDLGFRIFGFSFHLSFLLRSLLFNNGLFIRSQLFILPFPLLFLSFFFSFSQEMVYLCPAICCILVFQHYMSSLVIGTYFQFGFVYSLRFLTFISCGLLKVFSSIICFFILLFSFYWFRTIFCTSI